MFRSPRPAGAMLLAALLLACSPSAQGRHAASTVTDTIHADEPFRLRFETDAVTLRNGESRISGEGHRLQPGSSTAPSIDSGGRLDRLQVRRNGGDWEDVDIYDFPKPERELDLDFRNDDAGRAPEGWSVVQGDAAGVKVAAGRTGNLLRVSAERQHVTALYTPPWDIPTFEFATTLRLPADRSHAVGLVFGYVDEANHCGVFLSRASGTIRVSCLADGREAVVTEEKVAIPADEWLELALAFENGELEVDFNDETVEFTARLGELIPTAPVGFHVARGGSAEFAEFVIEGEPRTPPVSIVAESACDLLHGGCRTFGSGESEWLLVVRRYADGAIANEAGDTFEFRLTDGNGARVSGRPNPVFSLTIPAGHVGGTFVETPGRIGPWRASNGDLYFIMEPTETDNLFMMMKSTDDGREWHEVDGANRPATGDLESVDARLVDGKIHIAHQVTRSTRYHVFNTSDHPGRPDSWAMSDDPAAHAVAVAQATSLVVRSDGSLVAFHTGQTQLHYNVRSPAGTWGTDAVLDSAFVSPQAVLGANDVIHLAYYGTDGTIWYRSMLPDGSFTPAQLLARDVGTSRAVFGAVLPLVFIPETNTVVVVYRLASGTLWERRIVNEGAPTPPRLVSGRLVVTNAVDSQQPGADVVLDGQTVHVLFIDESSRSIYSTHDGGQGEWQTPALRVDGIRGSWVRGSVYTRRDGVRVYGYVYDAGSEGGSGMNRFAEVELR